MTGLLCAGFLANLLVRPVSEKFWIRDNHNLSKQGATH